ncbi:epoxyqueuosine reductase [Roseivirga ehrenbergii]|uniref:Epoxyqueuosine reductase n=1 Tax=Roseivirga ehrenbergii (strain DSM 102268 / JCM 13514 / KCTC 12282 / NCIMB 14502 / KMM 6017) TaxID=279360 RepID=A0A150XNA8_ROSEK|nr:tRNA epoxyqueuosine(34) reductase QueG [Roseivirga ehrenbergii]KYG80171.1 epoxyqueuosine reductase [Roseivirga ehrenbergii]TCK99202.1 epoxyqueuosine reductase [Roseivirga ehrenbergii]
MHNITANTTIVKQTAQKLGFDFCGISKAEFLADEAPRLEAWLKKGNHGEMRYMENHFDKRLDPSKLVPGAKSVVSLLYNYYPEKDLAEEHPDHLKLAKYAYGEDYHFVIKDRLKTFISILKEEIGDVEGRVFVDSAPVMERQWAAKSGLGWLGKNTLLINKGQGSYFFLAELIIDLELEPDGPIKDYCGTCTRCIDACPTDAITPYEVDANKCISYLTIELKDQIPDTFQGKMNNWIFGCDICQEVCPWNRFSKPHSEPTFHPKNELLELFNNNWQDLTEEVFRSVFKGSAVKRTKLEGLKRNIIMAKK